jgi:hypothetical protein
MKAGAEEFDSGGKETVSGIDGTAGGVAGAAVGLTPVGAAVNAMTGGAASRLAFNIGAADQPPVQQQA